MTRISAVADLCVYETPFSKSAATLLIESYVDSLTRDRLQSTLTRYTKWIPQPSTYATAASLRQTHSSSRTTLHLSGPRQIAALVPKWCRNVWSSRYLVQVRIVQFPGVGRQVNAREEVRQAAV